MPPRPRAVIVVTGSELVRGDRRDANGPFLAAELLRLGADPERIVIVSDREEQLQHAIAEGLKAELCILSGGLGPTHDDRTVELLARASGRPLEVDPALEAQIAAVSRRIAERLGRPYSDFERGVRKQASLPAGAASLGLAGTAPGVLLEHEHGVAVALPGPPAELQQLWRVAAARPEMGRLLGRARPREHRLLRLFGPGESAVARLLAQAGGEGDGLEITICARDFEIHVDLFAEPGAEARRDAVEAALRTEFASQLFSEDTRPIEDIVLDLARSRGLTIATAESCTGGIVGGRLTNVPGASDVYLGGIVAYQDSVKRRLLEVPATLLERHGAVSAEVAEAMAEGARRTLGADVGVAVTGIAGPGGGTAEKPVGLVFIHVAAPTDREAVRLELPGDRNWIRGRASAWVLHQIRIALSRSGSPSV